MFVDGSGTIFISDNGNNRIRKVTIIAVPTLVPFNGSTASGFTPTLDWNDAANAVSYTLEYADNAGFTGSTTVPGLTLSQFTFGAPLVDGTYFWRVKSVAADAAESAFSSADSFVIIPTFTEWTVMLLAMAMAGYLVWHRGRLQLTG